ncbi:MAG: hypothetical protein JKX92_15335 [Porticoccaceae bacterium]|nr:hypothetical protein [Porticoccaceae bacterium]
MSEANEVSQVERLVINGFETELIMPKDKEPILFLVQYDEMLESMADTWFGYFENGKWFGVAEDDEGWQEISGDVVCWIPLPCLSL